MGLVLILMVWNRVLFSRSWEFGEITYWFSNFPLYYKQKPTYFVKNGEIHEKLNQFESYIRFFTVNDMQSVLLIKLVVVFYC